MRRIKTKKSSTKKPQPNWPAPYKWVAMGTLVASTALGTRKVAYACPPQTPDNPTQNQAQTKGTLPTFKFNIPAGALGEVLDAFHAAGGWQVTIMNAGIIHVPSPGVVGVYTNEQALDHILSGTGVTYRFVGPNLISLRLASIQESITVSAADLQQEQVASAKYTAAILDTPQSISVVPQHIMSEQNTTTLRDTLRNVAGISLAAGEGGAQGDNLTIRGFTARNDIFLDGMRDFGSYYRDTFDQQEVQVLEGPSAVTFGRGTTGGIVNGVSKTPQLAHAIGGNITGGSDQTRRAALDINQPISQLGSGAAFRLNLMGDDNKIAGRDVGEYRRYGVAPSLALGLDGPTRLTFSYFRQSEDDTPDYGIPWLFNRPAPVDRSNYYGFAHGNFLKTSDDIFTTSVEHDVNEHITLRNTVRYAHEARDARITEAKVPTTVTLATPLDSIQITRNEINVDSTETALDDQMDAVIKFHTGSLRHTLATGLEAVRETSDPTRNTISNVPATSLLHPDESQTFAGTFAQNTAVNVTAFTIGAYAIDTVSLGSKFDVIGGGRWDRFDANYHQHVAPATAFNQVVNLPSWRGALVYKPKSNANVYFDVGNSFNPSAENLSLSAASANTPPETSLTFEVGTKWDLASGKFLVNGSLFRTDKTNAREPDPNNPLMNVLGGNQRVDGFQVSLAGRLTDRWQLLSSYALLDTKVVSSQFFPQAIGVQLANVPRNTFNLWTTYRFSWRNFQVGAGGNFVDRRTASSTAPYDPTTSLLKEVPGYVVFNAMASYPLNERASLQLNLNNLTNRYYYDQIHPAHIVPGAGFSALMGINFKF
ncbi:MAG TPA: TonB-dependent siderophore receptor [Terriglobales bacterium]|nr:TonB-dependent siderophore receptor [Terriglobales bacterium]